AAAPALEAAGGATGRRRGPSAPARAGWSRGRTGGGAPRPPPRRAGRAPGRDSRSGAPSGLRRTRSGPPVVFDRENALEPLAGAGEPGHHGSDRDAHHLADLRVREPLHVAQDHDLPELDREGRDRRLESFLQGAAQHLRLRIVRDAGRGVDGLVELGGVSVPPVPAEPGVAGVPHDREEPGAHVSAPEAAEVANRPEEGVLHRVLRVVVVPEEVARQRVRRVQVRESQFLELRRRGWVHSGSFGRGPSVGRPRQAPRHSRGAGHARKDHGRSIYPVSRRPGGRSPAARREGRECGAAAAGPGIRNGPPGERPDRTGTRLERSDGWTSASTTTTTTTASTAGAFSSAWPGPAPGWCG